ncbi:hypothetical protein Tco_0236876 [Tanacetum coccineum]|uniref:Uncharacterized protein n=1 Tax=Tanacetum coccineum TaxID=301880 RepID=A0ABQ5EV64_9ASTR
MPGGWLILAKALLEDQFLGDKIVSWMSRSRTCTAMSSERLNTWPLSCKFVLITIAISCILAATLSYQAHPYSISLYKEPLKTVKLDLNFVRMTYHWNDMFTKALRRKVFSYLTREIGMRCLTPSRTGWF